MKAHCPKIFIFIAKLFCTLSTSGGVECAPEAFFDPSVTADLFTTNGTYNRGEFAQQTFKNCDSPVK